MPSSGTAQTMRSKLLTNGRIFTSAAGDDGLYEAMLIDGEEVSFVGSAEDAEATCKVRDLHPEKIDLQGRLVLPGFIDAHAHLMLFGSSLSKLDCLSLSIPQIQSLILQHYESNPSTKMIFGKSFLFDSLGAYPHEKYLDEVLPDIPIFIDCADLHSCWLNSAAIDILGITRDTPDPKGGSFERDANGELTGMFLETAMFEVVWRWMSEQLTLEDRIVLLDGVFKEFWRTGVTGAADMAMTEPDLEALEEYYKRKGNVLPIRVSAYWLINPSETESDRLEQVKTAERHRRRLEEQGASPWLQVVGIKIISDGVIDACTAFVKTPYKDGTLAEPIWSKEELLPVMKLADQLDLQIAIHALGDAASEQALDIFEAIVEAQLIPQNRGIRRHRIEHLEIVTKESIARMSKLGIIASLQPSHADPVFLPNWLEMLNRDERCNRGFPWTEFRDSNTPIAFGSDTPVAPVHTLPGLYTATTRHSAVNPKIEIPNPDPILRTLEKFKLGLGESIRYYTAGSAFSVRQEGKYGILEKGMSADFCVLDVNPFGDGVGCLREAQEAVRETWIAGKRVWERE